MAYLFGFIAISASSFLAWFWLNSRQWLLAWLWLPVLWAGLAWWWEGGILAIMVYFLSVMAMMIPQTSIFAFLFQRIRMDNTSWETWDIREMWQNPTPMRPR